MPNFAIPPLPTIVSSVIAFDANDPKHGPADLEKLVLPDKAISADLLRVSNSAFYGRSGKVKILREALAVLGIKATKNLVIYLSTRTMTSTYKSATFKKYLVRYPIFSALTAQTIIQATAHKAQADEAFLAALLHSIGMNVLSLEKQGHFSDMLEACEKNKWDLLKLEKQAYGVTHLELGLQAVEHWGLPAIYSRLIHVTPSSDIQELDSVLEKSTFVAAVVASLLIEIPVSESSQKNAQDVFMALGGKGDLVSHYASQEALVRLNNHPFAILSGL